MIHRDEGGRFFSDGKCRNRDQLIELMTPVMLRRGYAIPQANHLAGVLADALLNQAERERKVAGEG